MDQEIDQVQAHISAISFPTSLEELLFIADDDGLFNLEHILNVDYENDIYEWTVPRWAKQGDIVLFYHTKTTNVHISNVNRLLREAEANKVYSDDELNKIRNLISKGKSLFKQYGGYIFAVGIMLTDPYYDDYYNEYDHFKSKVNAEIGYINVFEKPVHITEVESYIKIEQRSTTPLFGKPYDELLNLLYEKDQLLPDYFVYSESVEPLYWGINKNNWIKINNENRRRHQFEIQFRTFYVDYLLEELSDEKSIFVECACLKNGNKPSYVDNVIRINGKYLPIEVKLNIEAESDIKKQIRKYCYTKKLYLKTDEVALKEYIYNDNVVVIDTQKVFLFEYNKDELVEMFNLDDIKTKRDIKKLKETLLILLNDEEKNE